MPTRKRSYRFNCTELMVVLQEQSKRHSLESDRVPTGCARSASSLSLRLVWKRCHGHATAASARSVSTQLPNGGERTDNQAFGILGVPLTRARTMSKLSTHTHECPRCGMHWECGEANYQDECPYPLKTLCTKCWAQGPARAASLGKGKE